MGALLPGSMHRVCPVSLRCCFAAAAGRASEFGPGDACVIPAGFVGSFEVLEAVRKYYVVLERPAGNTV